MKRFNAQKELRILERRKSSLIGMSSYSNTMVPVFVFILSCVFLAGVSFSLNMEQETHNDLSYRENKANIEGVTIGDDYGRSVYFTNDINKYVLFNNILFKIVRINGDGTVRLMVVDKINNEYSEEYGVFNYDYMLDINTNINNWFNHYFTNNQNVVEGIFDNNKYNDEDIIEDLINIENKNFSYVGLLSYREFKLIYKYDSNEMFYLNNFNTLDNRYCVYNGVLELCNNDIVYDVLPVINIKVDYFMGDGTISNPYVISENMLEE